MCRRMNQKGLGMVWNSVAGSSLSVRRNGAEIVGKGPCMRLPIIIMICPWRQCRVVFARPAMVLFSDTIQA